MEKQSRESMSKLVSILRSCRTWGERYCASSSTTVTLTRFSSARWRRHACRSRNMSTFLNGAAIPSSRHSCR